MEEVVISANGYEVRVKPNFVALLKEKGIWEQVKTNIETVKFDVSERYLKSVETWVNECMILGTFLQFAFSWNKSPEGHKYWNDIYMWAAGLK